MKTAVRTTSKGAFHLHKSMIDRQNYAVAQFIYDETRAGRWVWISKIAENAALIGHHGLAQLSSASRALNSLKDKTIIIEGFEYGLVRGLSFKPRGGTCKVEPWAMVLKSSQPKK